MSDKDDTQHSTYKTRIDAAEMESFLKGKYGDAVAGVTFLRGGETSQAFSFENAGEKLLIRVNKHNSNGFEKDRYVHGHYSSDRIPTADILEIGKMPQGNFYAISKMIEGQTVNSLSSEALRKIVPISFKMLDEVHSLSLEGTKGYGYWNAKGEGEHSSWKEVIVSMADRYERWDKLFATTFMERSVHAELSRQIKDLVVLCPEERYLMHGDYGFDNMISDGERIVGVIDWAESRYGDFLYDAAWLSFWPSDFDFKAALDTHYAGRSIPHYEERIRCYHAYIALNSLSFYAYSNQRDKYDWAKGRIAKLLGITL
ncbi:MAG TPA: aminoglycoside phosphotransferase family protein [Candidatus Paceibacterota bacterium]